MTDETTQAGIERIARALAAGGRNVVFTGAGISTESGIPDYRSKGGIWERFKPVMYDDFLRSREARAEYWRRKAELYDDFAKARPNPAHEALAALHAMGRLEAVITQNVDGLHQDAGVPDDAVVEVHGSARRIRCLSCGDLIPIDDVYRRLREGDEAPECDCGGFLKPDTISFGQGLDAATLERAVALSRAADCFLVIGSTLLVHPAATMPVHAKYNGAFLAIVNLSDTEYDEDSDVVLRGKAGVLLPAILHAVQAIVAEGASGS